MRDGDANKVSSSDYWDGRFASGDTPWELSRPSTVLCEALDLLWQLIGSFEGLRTLSPGCGTGSDALELVERGLDVLAVDWSRFATTELKKRYQDMYRCNALVRGQLEVLEGDFFRLPLESGLINSFDLVCEHTFFCAIDPARRGEYVEVLAELLKSGGYLVGNFFVVASEGELSAVLEAKRSKQELFNPPFVILREELLKLLTSKYFEVMELRPAKVGEVERRVGIEWTGLFRRL